MKRRAQDDINFMLLKRKIFKDTSLDCHQFKDNYLKRRIGVRMRARCLENHSEYLHLLKKDPSEYDHLLNDITINVTRFFRDPEVFKLLEEEIIPLLIYNKVKKNRKIIRFWSAGCASGEEAYSLAIILRDLLGEEMDNFIASIHGTDIDDTSLNMAREGRYLPIQVENVKTEYLAKYLIDNGEMYQVSQEIKEMVKFRNQDLFSDKKGAHFDLISCRNVLIYFTKEMQKTLILQFYNALNDNGYLILGKTETLMGEASRKFKVIDTRERIYQKRSLN